jgi:hypothetical protein
MNPRLSIIGIFAVLPGIFGWFAFKYKQNEPHPAPTKSATLLPLPAHPAKAHSETEPPKGKYEAALSTIELTEAEAAAKPPDVSDASWLAAVFLHRVNVKEKNGNVEFFGKVVDQDAQPIESAKIKAYSAQYVESLKDQIAYGGGRLDTKTIEVATDGAGLFTISGYRARNLSFDSVQKPGYTSPSKLPGPFPFSPAYSSQHQANANDPVIFQLWKQETNEPVIKQHWQKRVVPDGRVYSFDLINGRMTEDDGTANLRLSVVADYSSTTGTTNYPWTIKIEAPGGGVVVTGDSHPYRAPESGYEPHISWNSTNTIGEWARDLTRTILIKGPGGEFYASAKMHVIVFHTKSASITMDTIVNPSGSRNLQ